MWHQKLSYLFLTSVYRIRAKPKLFCILLVSLSLAMLVPLFCTALAEAAYTESRIVQDKYTAHTMAYRVECVPLSQATVRQIETELCDMGVMASMLSEYILVDKPEGDKTVSGRFIPVNAVTDKTLALLAPTLTPENREAFAAKNGCMLDTLTARHWGVKVGDILLFRGNACEILALLPNQSGSVLWVPYTLLSSGMTYTHTLYLLLSAPMETKELRKVMREYLPEGSGVDIVPMSESYETKSTAAKQMTTVAMTTAGVYLLYALVSMAVMRYGEIRIHQNDYAVALAVGSSYGDIWWSMAMESALLIPAALVIDGILFQMLHNVIPLPYTLSLSPVTLFAGFAFALVCSVIVACTMTRTLTTKTCADLWKEV